jgi:N,N'-diacetyllegionaminate synthase
MVVASRPQLRIADRVIGGSCKAFVIAEVAQAHDGSLGLAHAFIDAVAKAGADAIKFQTHIADAESTLDEPFRVVFSQQDKTRFDYWRRMEFTTDQWEELARHSRERGLVFVSSAFSLDAVRLLEKLGMAVWKVASGEMQSVALLEAMVATGAPIMVSTGMATRAEIGEAAACLRAMGASYALLQCTSIYPTPLEKVGLNVMEELRTNYGCAVGLSDHSGSIFPGLAALARGADILEVHVTFHSEMFGPDVPASISMEQLRILCDMRDAVYRMDGNPVDKDGIASDLGSLRQMFGKSLAPICALSAGTVLTAHMLTAKKPGGGLSPAEADQLVGKRLLRDVTPQRILRKEDVEGYK